MKIKGPAKLQAICDCGALYLMTVHSDDEFVLRGCSPCRCGRDVSAEQFHHIPTVVPMYGAKVLEQLG
jgi:hypothetical protein